MTAQVAIYRTPEGQQAVEAAYRRALEHWPVPSRQQTVATEFGDAFVVVSGPATLPPLVLLHGAGTNTTMWMADIATLVTRFRVYAVDLIGEPGLSAAARPPLDSDSCARWLDAVLDGLGVTRTAIVGASLGAWVALDYAIRRPARVERLALLCPGGIGRQRMGWVIPAMLLSPFGRWGQRKTFELVAGLRTSDMRSFVDNMAMVFREFRPRRDRLPVFPDSALSNLDIPVLVLAGERDAMLDSAHTARRVTTHVPHATVRVLPGVGHAIVGQVDDVLAFLVS